MVGGESDLVSLLREEIVALVRRHVNVERDNIQVKMNRGGDVSTLEIEVRDPFRDSRKLLPHAPEII